MRGHLTEVLIKRFWVARELHPGKEVRPESARAFLFFLLLQ